MTKFRIELVNEAFGGLTFGFDVTIGKPEAEQGSLFASHESFLSLAEAASARAVAVDTAISDMAQARPGFDPDAPGSVTVSSISVLADQFDLCRFAVPMPDGTVEDASAHDYTEATMLAALKYSFQGRPFSGLLAPAGEIASSLSSAKTEKNGRHVEGRYCQFEVADWRVAEGASEGLSEEQKAPLTFTLVSGGYGPTALFRRGDEEYPVMMEISEGCVVARGSPSRDENTIVGFRLAREEAQAEIASGQVHVAYRASEDNVVRDESGPMTQDASEAPAPAA